jgi:hypothetical protein
MRSTNEEGHDTLLEVEASGSSVLTRLSNLLDTIRPQPTRFSNYNPEAPSLSPAPLPTVIQVQTDQGKSKNDKSGCIQCTGMTYLVSFIVLLIMGIVIVALLISFNNRWEQARETGEIGASYFTRYMSLQEHYIIDYFTDAYGDQVPLDQVPTETSKLLTRLLGSIDVHERRIDWLLGLTDPNGWMGSNPHLSLWAQKMNISGHPFDAPGSPIVLTPFASGVRDDMVISALGESDTILTLVITSSVLGQSQRQWFIPLKRVH